MTNFNCVRTDLATIDEHNEETVILRASEILKGGGLVAFPTETVYGLGASANDESACLKIFKAKGRPQDNPLILHVSSFEEVYSIALHVPETAILLAKHFWPGALTLIFKAGGDVNHAVCGGLDTVAVRFPSHRLANKLIKTCGFALAAPSANASGKPSPTSAQHVFHDLNGKVDMIIDGGECELGIESTIVDLSGDVPCVLRPGSITEDLLKAVLGDITIDSHMLENVALNPQSAPKAPGMKYTHYAPLADVKIVLGQRDRVCDFINEHAENSTGKVGIMATDQTVSRFNEKKFCVLNVGSEKNLEVVAKNLYAYLREFDLLGVDVVYSVGFVEDGLGFSIMNRLKKSSGFDITKV